MARAISGLLQSHNATRLLVAKAWSLAKLDTAIHDALPLELRALGSIQVGDLVDGELTLLVANAALASRLRFATNTVLAAISKEGRLKVSRIKVRVTPPRPQSRKPIQKNKRRITESDQAALMRAAKATSDPSLAAAFRRLASRNSQS